MELFLITRIKIHTTDVASKVMSTNRITHSEAKEIVTAIREKAYELGFQQMGVTDTALGDHIQHYQDWLNKGFHGELDYMDKHGAKRWTPEQLIPGTLRVISLRMDYYSDNLDPAEIIASDQKAYISRYTLGRDYHKLIRNRLSKLIKFIEKSAQAYDYRAFVDSAPVLERALAQKAGLGWFGKNTMILNRSAGSWFFLGEIYTNLPLPIDAPYEKEHCGKCTACLDICPTNAFEGPYLLDGRKCISYLTIELKGSIPVELRSKMGNRIFGCDDCQIVCPWNRFSTPTKEEDFSPRHQLNNQELVTLFKWDEETFLKKTEGSAIRRTGYENWLRNIAVALGNADTSPEIVNALRSRSSYPSPIVKEHVIWALSQHNE